MLLEVRLDADKKGLDPVLILIVMEDALREIDNSFNGANREVLILIVMEDALRVLLLLLILEIF